MSLRIAFALFVLDLLLVAQVAPGQASSSGVQETPPALDPPRLRVEPAGKLDLGELGPREPREQRYTFTNTSDRPISLRLFDLAPGVSVAGPALRAAIPARGAAELTLRVDPTDWVGHQTRNVRLGTDDPRQGHYYLPTELTVRPDLSVDGERRDLGDVAAPGAAQAVFRFTRETGQPVVLQVEQPLPPYLELDREQGRNSASLTFTLRTDRVEPGVLLGFERIKVTTNAPLQPRFDLYLSWRLHHPLQARPARVVFQARSRRTLQLDLSSHSGLPFRILRAEVAGKGFQVSRPASRPAPRQTLTIRRTGSAMAKAMLVLHCQGEPEPMRVPLFFLP